MGVRANAALLFVGLAVGCDKKNNKNGAVTDDGGGGAGLAGFTGSAGNGGAGSAGGSAAGAAGGAITDGGRDVMAIDAACVPTELTVTGTHPDILIVLDASGSMDNDVQESNCDYGCGLMSKWALTTAAVKQAVAATGTNVSWGLKFFADQDQMCTVSPGVSVPIGLGNAAAITTAIARRTSANGGVANGGATPTRAAQSAAVTYLSGIADGNPKFVLLATDGQPNCPASGGDTNGDDSAAAIQVVSDAYRAGVPTFVVGIGTLSSTEVVLDALARAGGHPQEGEHAYYPASSTADLVATLNELVLIARSCRIDIVPPAGSSRDAIDILRDGVVVPRDPTHANGWDYSDPGHTGVDLYGAACTSVLTSTTTRLSVAYHCPPAG